GLVQSDPSALAVDGWLVYGNVFDSGGTYLYGYGPFTAPNDGFAFCQIDLNQGGTEQGVQQLVVFSDYNNAGHAAGNLIESNVYREYTITADDAGKTFRFAFQAKKGNLAGASTAAAFIKTLDPNNGWAMTNFLTADMTNAPDTWTGAFLTLAVDAGMVGQIFQIGFMNTATNYEGSGIFYDNIQLYEDTTSAVPTAMTGAALGQNYPNPFNPSTRIDFSLEKAGRVELAVYDVAGRLVATLQQGSLDAGDHHVVWNGRTATGAAAPAGVYAYVLRTAEGSVSRAMTLVK
ncbi:MAG TPA: FlgD immunoglobulin-like domain containing protein, partial [Candidatus Krumholzibacteria bacterium]|nr:FlgD immunoglobulin-like domain containing protein [Candidatus Krumholzibacteria bacterium]